MPPAAAPPPFAVECACGTVARGDRQPTPQILTCAGCGKPVFVFPAAASVFGPAAAPAPAAAAWAARARFWLPPAAAAVLAVAVVGVVIAAIVRGRRPESSAPAPAVSETRAAVLLTGHLTAAKAALDEGSFRLATGELDAAGGLFAHFPRALEPDKARQLRRWRRQAALLADLSAESVEEIVRHAVGRADKEWDAVFRERYAGKAVVLDTRAFRDAAGRFHVDYQLEAAGGVGEWDFDRLRLFEALPLQQPQRVFFGFRLKSIRRLSRATWTVEPDPDSGVLLTDQEVLTGLSIVADDELKAVMKKQAEWEP